MSDYLDKDDGREYQELSRWAVVSLLLGLLSITVLVHLMFFWVVPVLAILFGVIGLKKTGPESGYVGRSVVVVGLVLSMLFASCAVTRHVVRRSMIYKQATEHATMWLSLVGDGKLYRAHQLIKPPIGRAAPTVLLNDYYENDPSAKLEVEAYFGEEPLRQLVQHGGEGTISLVRNVKQSRKLMEDTVEQLYHLEYTVDGEREIVPIETVLMRRYDYQEGSCHWELRAIGMPENRPSP